MIILQHGQHRACNSELTLNLMLQVCHGCSVDPDCGVSTEVLSRCTVVLGNWIPLYRVHRGAVTASRGVLF